jgi:periplasmic divalent cation tolerance protein
MRLDRNVDKKKSSPASEDGTFQVNMISTGITRVALSTVGSSDEAATIARALVVEQLAACVNIVPGVRSIYRWQGEVHDDAEWLLVIKTTAAHLEQLESRLKALHSYENPEFLVLVPESGSEAYLLWIDQCLSQFGHGQPRSV